jgi:hypothetical protein
MKTPWKIDDTKFLYEIQDANGYRLGEAIYHKTAVLFAVAPELLDALERIENVTKRATQGHDANCECDGCWTNAAARAAIAKAK